LPLDEIMVCDIKGMLIVSFPQNCWNSLFAEYKILTHDEDFLKIE
jgi:hypothetical protein